MDVLYSPNPSTVGTKDRKIRVSQPLVGRSGKRASTEPAAPGKAGIKLKSIMNKAPNAKECNMDVQGLIPRREVSLPIRVYPANNNPESRPVITPHGFNFQISALYALDTITHPTRLNSTARILGSPSFSLNSHKARIAVKPAEPYASTVATAAPLNWTERTQMELKTARRNP